MIQWDVWKTRNTWYGTRIVLGCRSFVGGNIDSVSLLLLLLLLLLFAHYRLHNPVFGYFRIHHHFIDIWCQWSAANKFHFRFRGQPVLRISDFYQNQLTTRSPEILPCCDTRRSNNNNNTIYIAPIKSEDTEALAITLVTLRKSIATCVIVITSCQAVMLCCMQSMFISISMADVSHHHHYRSSYLGFSACYSLMLHYLVPFTPVLCGVLHLL